MKIHSEREKVKNYMGKRVKVHEDDERGEEEDATCRDNQYRDVNIFRKTGGRGGRGEAKRKLTKNQRKEKEQQEEKRRRKTTLNM